MSYANARNVPYVALVGADEMRDGTVSLKDMVNGEQKNAIDRRSDSLDQRKRLTNKPDTDARVSYPAFLSPTAIAHIIY